MNLFLSYAPGSREKVALKKALAEMSSKQLEIPLIIGGKEIRTGNLGKVVMPHDHKHVLATYHKAGPAEVQQAIDAAVAAQPMWQSFRWEERCAIFLKVAELLAVKYRALINSGAMLAGGKTAYQAEIDAACELIDFLRYQCALCSGNISETAGVIPRRLEFCPASTAGRFCFCRNTL